MPLEFSTVQYTTPPTLERQLQQIDHGQYKTAGARVRLDWAQTKSLMLYANYGAFRDWQGFGNPACGSEDHTATGCEMTPAATIHDPYVGVELRWSKARSRASLAGGFHFVQADGVDRFVRSDGHIDFDLEQSLGSRLALEIHGYDLERAEIAAGSLASPAQRITWREGTMQLGLRFRPYLSGAFILDYTTQATEERTYYYGGAAQWDITSASSLRLFVGSSRGGLKCVSGVCRTYPPFDGVRLSLIVRL